MRSANADSGVYAGLRRRLLVSQEFRGVLDNSRFLSESEATFDLLEFVCAESADAGQFNIIFFL